MDFPDPVIGLAVEPKTQADVDKLGYGDLAKLAEEDPTFQVKTDEDSGQTVISGMGELHLEISSLTVLKREFKVECNQGAPQVTYKEAIVTTTVLSNIVRFTRSSLVVVVSSLISSSRFEPDDAGFRIQDLSSRTRSKVVTYQRNSFHL